MAKKYTFTDVNNDIVIGEKSADSLHSLGKSAESAWRDNMDTFTGPGCNEITRVTESESDRVSGWFNNHSGKFTPR